jgi:hypothetical protein
MGFDGKIKSLNLKSWVRWHVGSAAVVSVACIQVGRQMLTRSLMRTPQSTDLVRPACEAGGRALILIEPDPAVGCRGCVP